MKLIKLFEDFTRYNFGKYVDNLVEIENDITHKKVSFTQDEYEIISNAVPNILYRRVHGIKFIMLSKGNHTYMIYSLGDYCYCKLIIYFNQTTGI
jgi:hypothetical protein